MAAMLPGAFRVSVVWIFLLWPGRMGGMWSVIFAERAGPPWVRDRDARKIAHWIKRCFEAACTIKGDGLSGIVPQSMSRMDLQRWAMSVPEAVAAAWCL